MAAGMIKDFIDLADFSASQIKGLLERAISEKARLRRGELPPTLERRTLAMIFEKMSLRTRVSFETAMTQLGGHAISLSQGDIGLGSREPARDVARVLGRMCDGIMARTFAHESVVQLAKYSPVPVINALSDYSHPCQAMADLMTVIELARTRGENGDLAGKVLLFVGDGNNVARSLATACVKLGMKFILAAPQGYELEQTFVESLGAGGGYSLLRDPAEAIGQADVVYTDTWISMGQEDEKPQRLKDFAGFQIDSALMAAAPGGAVVMHCLPAYRGYEISEDVFEAHAETIFAQADNRLHFQRALLNALMADGGIE